MTDKEISMMKARLAGLLDAVILHLENNHSGSHPRNYSDKGMESTRSLADEALLTNDFLTKIGIMTKNGWFLE